MNDHGKNQDARELPAAGTAHGSGRVRGQIPETTFSFEFPWHRIWNCGTESPPDLQEHSWEGWEIFKDI